MPATSRCFARILGGLVFLTAATAFAANSTPPIVPKSPITLFNGKDLTGFYTWLRNLKYEDPDKVFTVVTIDGGPAIRASGQHFGGIVTKERYANYRLTLEFRWGLRGTLFIGEKGTILTGSSGASPRLFPDRLRATYQRPAAVLPRSNGHHREWVDACKGGSAPGSHFERGARLTEIAHLGTLALRTRQVIRWDAAKMEAKGVPQAAPFIGQEYRKGWELA